MQTSKTVTLFLARSTQGTHVYTENEGPRHLRTFPTVYVQQHVLPNPPPPQVTIEIKWEAQ